MSVIDDKGYRENIGMIVCNDRHQVLWAKRKYPEDAWQFPQGGLEPNETLVEAMYRELAEELGLNRTQVKLLGQTKSWLYYDLPTHCIRYNQQPLCVGQKQHWFLLQLIVEDANILLEETVDQEFVDWRWVDYDYPIQHVISFKKDVYKAALDELRPYLVTKA